MRIQLILANRQNPQFSPYKRLLYNTYHSIKRKSLEQDRYRRKNSSTIWNRFGTYNYKGTKYLIGVFVMNKFRIKFLIIFLSNRTLPAMNSPILLADDLCQTQSCRNLVTAATRFKVASNSFICILWNWSDLFIGEFRMYFRRYIMFSVAIIVEVVVNC